MPVIEFKQLSREQTQLFKGIAILMIVLHNYFHWVLPKPGENEFTFQSHRFESFIRIISEQPAEIFHTLFAYLGHYGVLAFIFLSAYGLTRSSMNKTLSWMPFMWGRVKKLYPVFIVAILVHMLMLIWHGETLSLWYMKVYALRLSFLSNFVPGMALQPNGPWWFFSFIVQFYAVFPLMMILLKRWGGQGMLALAAGAFAARIFINPILVEHDLNLFHTVIGYLPELCFGMYLAAQRTISVSILWILFAGLIFILGNWIATVWAFSSICVTVLMLLAFQSASPWLQASRRLYSFLMYLGFISFPLFAVHGVLRGPFVTFANEYQTAWITLLVGIGFLIFSIFASDLAGRVASLLVKLPSRFGLKSA